MNEQEEERMWSAIYQLQNEISRLTNPKDNRFSHPYTPRKSMDEVIGTQPRQTTLDEFKEKTWTGMQWEQWASDIYIHYPQVGQYLPDWFITRMQRK
jgi:hypothetical protein